MVANIYINGDIGRYTDVDGEQINGVVLLDIIEQVKKHPNALRYKVNIRTNGGSIEEGNKIKDYLLSLGTPIDTYGFDIVASMGTSIFLIGEKRELQQGTEFFIHLPQGGIYGDSESIMNYANGITELQKNLIKEYKEVTGLTEEALLPLLRDETTLSVDQAYNLGFANYKREELQPVAYFNTNTNNMNTLSKDDKSYLEGMIAKITNLFKKETLVNSIHTAADGETMIDFPDKEEGQPFAVGMMATIDGQPAEGEYVMPSGMTFVFSGGELVEIKEATQEEGQESDAEAKIKELLDKIANSEELIASKDSEIESQKTQILKMKTKLKNVETEFNNFKKTLTTKFEFTSVKENKGESTKQSTQSDAKQALKNLREKRKNNR